MKFKYLLTAILLLNICFYSASNIAEAKCEDSRKVINLTREVIKNQPHPILTAISQQ